MHGLLRAIVIGAVLVSALPAGAVETQLDARDEPHVDGPLAEPDRACSDKDEVRTEDSDEPIASARSCVRFYRFQADAENDPDRDFGIVWMQSNVNARRGWCATRVRSKFVVPEGVHVEAMSPQSLEARRRKQVTISISSDAGASTQQTATISQDLLLYPKTFGAELRREGALVSLNWAGRSSAKLGFAGGATVSWNPDAGPPSEIPYDIGYRFRQGDGC